MNQPYSVKSASSLFWSELQPTSSNTIEATTTTKLHVDRKRASIEILPTEVKVMILGYLPNEATLNNVTKAFPIYRSVQDGFDEVLTAITINQLRERGFDTFGSHNVMQVCLHDKMKADGEFEKAVQSFWNGCQDQKTSTNAKPIRLPATVCRQILSIVTVVGWLVVGNKEDIPCSGDFPLSLTSFEYRGIGSTREKTGYLTGYPSDAVDSRNCSFVFLGRWDGSPYSLKKAVEDTIRYMSYCREFPSLP